jgi:hypothetical protein
MYTRYLLFLAMFTTGIIACSPEAPRPDPISLHPDNPHYFLFRGKPAVLIGSTEHYGAVLNQDFDYRPYFDELAARGLNLTRTFTGAYVEPEGAFGIERNTLAPLPGRFLCPWARSDEPGYAVGGNKFDLDRWDEAYFTRLRDFVAEAGARGIVVELALFSNYYDTLQWSISPLYIENNINGVGDFRNWREVLSLNHPDLLAVQEKMVRKIAAELNGFDNLYYEICNEPYFGDTAALRTWQDHMTGVLAAAEAELPRQHLISHNIANGERRVERPHPAVSILNFHYAHPPNTVGMNYHHGLAIGDNETGFDGIEDLSYRTEAWEFLLAGGSLFNHLDFSFVAGYEDGSFPVRPGQPGGGGPVLRKQLGILAAFVQELDYLHMAPAAATAELLSPEGARIQVLAKPGEQYGVYIGTASIPLQHIALRYLGALQAASGGPHTLLVRADDGLRLWLDGRLLIDRLDRRGPGADSVRFDFQEGRLYDLRIDYVQQDGDAQLQLLWSRPGHRPVPVPPAAFLCRDRLTQGLDLEWYQDTEFIAKTHQTVASRVSFDGRRELPFAPERQASLRMELPAGDYTLRWTDTKTGAQLRQDVLSGHAGGPATLESPRFTEDIALQIRRTNR